MSCCPVNVQTIGAMSKKNLWSDGIHLVESAKVIIANNLIKGLDYF